MNVDVNVHVEVDVNSECELCVQEVAAEEGVVRSGDRRSGEANRGVCTPRLLHMEEVWPEAHQRLALSKVGCLTQYNLHYKLQYRKRTYIHIAMYELLCMCVYVSHIHTFIYK